MATRRGRTVRFDLRGRQRRSFLGASAACAGAATVVAVASHPWTDPWLVGFAALLGAVAAYYLRVAYGWTVADAAGLRTSRLVRGRSVRWGEIESITTRTYRGKGGGVTVARVHTVSGRTFLLPAPRTTAMPWGDREFHEAVRYLQARADQEPRR